MKLVTTSYPELVWELLNDGVVGRVEALDGETVWITRINVQPGHRGRGYASILLRTVLASYPDTPIGLAAAPLPDESPALDRGALYAWYTRHGFVHMPMRGDPHRMLRLPGP
ncbi:GNAT family N-acetyltransferase [Streptomyces sp. NRRL F-5053]|uniref:GNAT family N-acetyltransferase n=1 Tax=Streptomyces sp. NRRL F-5053 TaxID=1463854 RepID=UPI0013313DDB|nr:GNAT family N-acetyltransferase [Streptomyces sp. NRRL F-5053]